LMLLAMGLDMVMKQPSERKLVQVQLSLLLDQRLIQPWLLALEQQSLKLTFADRIGDSKSTTKTTTLLISSREISHASKKVVFWSFSTKRDFGILVRFSRNLEGLPSP